MKLILVFTFVLSFGLQATSYSQEARINLDVKTATTVKTVLKMIEEQTNFRFFYNSELAILNKTVTVSLKNKTIFETLDVLFSGTSVGYRVLENNFVVLSLEELFQQGISVSGTVSDAEGVTLPGVNVLIKGSKQGTVTDVNGAFSLTVPDENAMLVFSSLGYTPQEMVVGSQRDFKVSLSEGAQQIEEVVVVGYGTQKVGNLTAAISTIKAEEIQTTTSSSVALKLQGKVPGLNIRQNTGEPGIYDNAINIRGFGTPLFVIDGVQRPAEVMSRLNGADIESVTVLKDASAAIYGMNAANGVLIVTTKQGRNEKTKFQFNSSVGFSTPTDVPRMCNAYEYHTLRNEVEINLGRAPSIVKDELEKWKAGGPGYESTDWYDATFDKYSLRQEYNLSAEGGTEKITYYFNLGGAFDDGLLKTGDIFYRRLNFRSNITAQLTKHIKAVVNVAAVNDKNESPVNGIFQIWRGVVTQLPTKKVYANDNPLYLNRVQDGDAVNPVAVSSSDLSGYSRGNNNLYTTSVEFIIDLPFVPGLQLKALAAYDKFYNMGKGVRKDFDLYDYDVAKDTYNAYKFFSPSSISNSYSNVYYLTGQAQADYKTVIKNNHNVSATVVYEVRDAAERHASITKYYDFYTNDQIDQASDKNARSGGNEWQQRHHSYIGRVNYDWKGRYLIEFAGRYDGSYRYHPDRRWGFFPLMSAGWRISDEKFMSSLSSVLSNMKIRGSYGKIGEDTGKPFQYVPGFTTGGGWWEFKYGTTTLGLNTPALVNERLTWMNSVLTDIGIDMSFFKHKLAITFDWYQKDLSGIPALRIVSYPNTFGATFPEENLNKGQVKGFDLSIEHKNSIGEVNYKISGNFNYARSKAVYIEQGNFTNSYKNYQSNQTGRYQGVVWNYHVIGRYQSMEEIQAGAIQNGGVGNLYVLPGDFIYEDVNGDHFIDGNNDTRPHFYDNNPKMNYGLSLGASWKGFDINVFFQGAALFSMKMENVYGSMFWNEANLPAYFMDRWHREDPYDPGSKWIPGKFPAARIAGYQSGLTYDDNDFWRKDCSYVRLKNISVGYTLPQRYIHKAGLDKVRIFADVNNLYTWANEFVKPFDPEKVSINFGWVYPIMKTWNIGLDISF